MERTLRRDRRYSGVPISRSNAGCMPSFCIDRLHQKKFIDVLAVHKMNTFHWHLTDDQGWRIEIKKYPKLTEIGSQRSETMVDYFYTHYPFKYDGNKSSCTSVSGTFSSAISLRSVSCSSCSSFWYCPYRPGAWQGSQRLSHTGQPPGVPV